MDLLEMICKELGVEIGEKWEGNDGYKYRISKNGKIFVYDKRGFYTGSCGFGRWESVFNGDLKPKWKPKWKEEYYVPDLLIKDLYDVRYWTGSEFGKQTLERNLAFKTKEEAINCAISMIELAKHGI